VRPSGLGGSFVDSTSPFGALWSQHREGSWTILYSISPPMEKERERERESEGERFNGRDSLLVN